MKYCLPIMLLLCGTASADCRGYQAGGCVGHQASGRYTIMQRLADRRAERSYGGCHGRQAGCHGHTAGCTGGHGGTIYVVPAQTKVSYAPLNPTFNTEFKPLPKCGNANCSCVNCNCHPQCDCDPQPAIKPETVRIVSR